MRLLLLIAFGLLVTAAAGQRTPVTRSPLGARTPITRVPRGAGGARVGDSDSSSAADTAATGNRRFAAADTSAASEPSPATNRTFSTADSSTGAEANNLSAGGNQVLSAADSSLNSEASNNPSGVVALPAGFISPPPHVAAPAGARTDHPRLLFTSADIPTLRSWAVITNPRWGDLTNCAGQYKTKQDDGTLVGGDSQSNHQSSPVPEDAAQIFAFLANVDPSPANRADYAQRAHDLIMPIVTSALTTTSTGVGYGDPTFATTDRARWYGESFPLVVDWIYSSFSSSEKATIRQCFLKWTQQCLTVSANSLDLPSPAGVYNDPRLYNTTTKIWGSGNNYWCSHPRQIALMAMCMDPADDVPSSPGDPSPVTSGAAAYDSVPAGILGDMLQTVVKEHLYIRAYTETHDLRGGLSHEGYQYATMSLGSLAVLFAAMRTAGYDDPATYGANVALATTTYWATDVPNGLFQTLSPVALVQGFAGGGNPSYVNAVFGDVQDYSPNDFTRVYGGLGLYDKYAGNTAAYNAQRWLLLNSEPGGSVYLDRWITACIADSAGTHVAVYAYLLLDPTLAAPADPRPSVPLDFYAAGLNRMLSRDSWSSLANQRWLTFMCMPVHVDHQDGEAGQFEFWRKGNWLTKNVTGYGVGINSADSKDTIALENTFDSRLQVYNQDAYHHGGTYIEGINAGDPTAIYSFGPANAYAYLQADWTKLQNAGGPYLTNDISHCSRSLFWLKPDFIYLYDRAESLTAGRYKRVSFFSAATPAVSGQVGTITEALHGNQLFVTTLLPATATMTALGLPDYTQDQWFPNESPAQWETMAHRLLIEDPAKPTRVRFLHVLQGADSGASRTVPAAVQSSAGDAFDGALVAGTCVMFKQDITAAFTGTTFSVVTAGTTAVYVTGLSPSTSYTVTPTTVGSDTQYVIAPGSGSVSDSAGVLKAL